MDENEAFEAFREIFSLCESDPDAGLEWIRKSIREKPELELESNVFLSLCRATAYGIKGTQPFIDRPFVNVQEAEPEELRLYINDEHLNCLELALLEFGKIEDIAPYLKWLGKEREALVDKMACILERCRPGRIQQILGKTKLWYFGGSRIGNTILKFANTDFGRLPLRAEELGPFLLIPFSFPSIAKSAILVFARSDKKGRTYVECILLSKTLDDFAPDETVDDVKIGEIRLYDDRTYRILGGNSV